MLLLAGALLLCACSPDNDGTETDDSVENNESSEPVEGEESIQDESDATTEVYDDGKDFEGTWLVEAGAPVFDIVYSENAIFDCVPTLAGELADCLEQSCGVEFSVYSDKTQAKNENLIVFGDPSDELVFAQMNALDKGGYKIFYKDGNINIIAFDSEAMEQAVELLSNDITQSAKKFSGGKKVGFSFSERAEAGTSDKKIFVGENRIELYTIVYSASNRYGRDAALQLRKDLSDTLGVELKVTDDKAPATKLEILVGNTTREESVAHYSTVGNKWKLLMGYEYRIINGKISLAGADENYYCVSMACQNFTENLIDGETFVLNKSSLVKKSLKMQADAFAKRHEDADVRIMTANILSEEWGGSAPELRSQLFYDNLCYYKPDVVGVQEVSYKWSVELKAIFENSDYTLIHEKSPNGKTNYSAMIYNTATTELIESGVQQMSMGNPIGARNISWGVFKDKATQKMYVVINTHPDWINTSNPDSNGVNSHYSREKQIRELIALYKEITAKYKNLDVFLTADWNTKKDVHPFNILLDEIPVVFSQDLVTGSDWGSSEIDYILATRDSNVLVAHVYSANSQVAGVSDHPFGFVDVKLK